MDSGLQECIAGVLRTSVGGLVRSLGGGPVSFDKGESRTAATETVAVSVSFGNETLRGLFGMVAEPRLFVRLSPGPWVSGRGFLNDWACEFANQVVGRFRNGMRIHGALLSSEPPQLTRPDRMNFATAYPPIRISAAVRIDDMVLDAWIDLDSQSAEPVSQHANQEIASAMLAEGEVLLF
jgi:hypothetical protein